MSLRKSGYAGWEPYTGKKLTKKMRWSKCDVIGCYKKPTVAVHMLDMGSRVARYPRCGEHAHNLVLYSANFIKIVALPKIVGSKYVCPRWWELYPKQEAA